MTQIKATVIADSFSATTNQRITTFELEYPRWVHAELMTHRMFSRNAASSRAIPVHKTAHQIKHDPAQPVMWGANQSGMQSDNEISGIKLWLAKRVWNVAAYTAASFSQLLAKLGMHKQYANRVSEYAQTYKVLVTATSFDNFFNLRCHADAQPEIRTLSKLMYEALSASQQIVIYPGEWHLPYVERTRHEGDLGYSIGDDLVSLEEAQKVSASCSAQISYRLLDTSVNKADFIYSMLVLAEPLHASPFEHLATPMDTDTDFTTEGVTHMDKLANYWSGNFCNWIQYRHLLPKNTCYNYVKDD